MISMYGGQQRDMAKHVTLESPGALKHGQVMAERLSALI
jgi:hypothetical protein